MVTIYALKCYQDFKKIFEFWLKTGKMELKSEEIKLGA
jgi:hypothetical protein